MSNQRVDGKFAIRNSLHEWMDQIRDIHLRIISLFCVVRESKCTIAQVNAPVFQCEGVVGLWLPDLKVCCIAFEVIRDRNRRFLREFLRGVFGFAKI